MRWQYSHILSGAVSLHTWYPVKSQRSGWSIDGRDSQKLVVTQRWNIPLNPLSAFVFIVINLYSRTQIPTIIAYQNGEAKAFGAEAREHLDDEEYEITKWFKVSK